MSRAQGTYEIDGKPWAKTDGKEIIRRCEQIMADYPRALELGKRASERMHREYKWSDSAARFIEICKEYVG
jgi:hypothetical protein